MSLKHTQAVIRKVKMEVNMKNSLPILVMLALLVAFPATAAWSQSNDARQCMETCLEPAIKSGDEDVIKQAVKQCKAQCNPEPLGSSQLGSTSSGMSTSSLGMCDEICRSRFEQCFVNGHSLEHCSQVLEGCLDFHCLE
jgi:hypothetical protein